MIVSPMLFVAAEIGDYLVTQNGVCPSPCRERLSTNLRVRRRRISSQNLLNTILLKDTTPTTSEQSAQFTSPSGHESAMDTVVFPPSLYDGLLESVRFDDPEEVLQRIERRTISACHPDTPSGTTTTSYDD